MVREIASITIDPLRSRDFEAAVAAARPHFEAAPGFIDFALERSMEHPERYRLLVGWETVEAHMVDFRASEGFQNWRNLAGPFFVGAPAVEHAVRVL